MINRVLNAKITRKWYSWSIGYLGLLVFWYYLTMRKELSLRKSTVPVYFFKPISRSLSSRYPPAVIGS